MHDVRQALRRRMRALGKSLPEQEKEEQSQAIMRHLANWPALTRARVIGAYAATAYEVDLQPLLTELIARGTRIALPRCEGKRQMHMIAITDWAQLTPDAFGILTPREGGIIPPEDIELMLVPCLALDARGVRLGQGGGYYDRYLPQTPAVRCGVVYAHQRVGALANQPHDAPMHYCAWQGGVVSFENR